ncbi:MAG: ABC transporter C-terminal domain-containing protein, partial [Bacteroidales bacterium]|nr:ABC transporter C-terminal domain-containing protein [Bacteroidales bacterium]
KKPVGVPSKGGAVKHVEQQKLSFEEQKQAKKLKNRQSTLEKQIVSLEVEMSDIEKVLAAPTAETDIIELTRKYLDLKRDLDLKMEEWAGL